MTTLLVEEVFIDRKWSLSDSTNICLCFAQFGTSCCRVIQLHVWRNLLFGNNSVLVYSDPPPDTCVQKCDFTVLRHNARNKRCNSSEGKFNGSHVRCDLHKQPVQVTTADGYSETAVSTKTRVKNPWKDNLVDRAMMLSTFHFYLHKQRLQYRPNDGHL